MALNVRVDFFGLIDLCFDAFDLGSQLFQLSGLILHDVVGHGYRLGVVGAFVGALGAEAGDRCFSVALFYVAVATCLKDMLIGQRYELALAG